MTPAMPNPLCVIEIRLASPDTASVVIGAKSKQEAPRRRSASAPARAARIGEPSLARSRRVEPLSQRVRRPLCLVKASDELPVPGLLRVAQLRRPHDANPTYLGRGIRRRQTQLDGAERRWAIGG